MRRLTLAPLILCLFATFAEAQDWPKSTEAGEKALDALIARCVEAGGLARTRDATTGRDVLGGVDAANLSRILTDSTITEFAPIRDALVARARSTPATEQLAWVAMLRGLGEVTGDGRAQGFTAAFDGRRLSSNDAAAATDRYRQAAELFEKAGDRPWQATCLNEVGLTCYSRGIYRDALESFRKSLAVRLETLGPRHPDVAMSHNNIAACQAGLGEPARALESLQKALAIRLEALGPRHLAVAMSHNNIAVCQRDLGEPARALESHQKALVIRMDALGPRHPLIASSHSNIAVCQRDLGEPARALESFQKALAIQLDALGPKHPDVAAILLNIADCQSDLGEPARALESHQKALVIQLDALGPRHPAVASGHSGIAVCQRYLGEPARALESFQKALAIQLDALGPRHPDIAMCHFNISLCQSDLGASSGALGSLGLALQALKPSESSPRTDMAAVSPLPASSIGISILFRRARLLAMKGAGVVADQERALSDLNLAADMLDRLRDSASGSSRTQEVDLARRGEDASDLWPVAIGLLAGLEERGQNPARLEAALGMAERGASRAFLQSFGRAHAELAGRVSPEALAEIARYDSRLFVLDQKIDKAQSVPVEKRDPKVVGALLDERRQAEAERGKVIARIEQEFPQYAALKYPRPCTLDQARVTLGADEVALHFVAGTEASFLVVLEKTPRAYPTGIGIHPLPADGELAEQVARLVQERVLMDAEATRERASKLYQTLLSPAARAIEGRNLVIVVGGAVGELPFEILTEPDGRGGQRWLIQGHRVRYAPSLTALHFVGLWDKAHPATDRPLWTLGDPTYGTDDPRLTKAKGSGENASITLTQVSRATRGESLTRLLASGAEVDRIAGVYQTGAADRLLGPEATEAAVKRLSNSVELAHYRLVHFACHGVLGTADGLPPGLVLAQGGDQEGEDGYLRLDEVANLKLDADLVVLSACQTARGKRGRVEGVSSLGRAFLYAGCRGVVGSLWKVDDATTADLMAAFYTRLKAGQTAGEALRATQLEAIADDQPPYFWAPFVLIGR